MILSNAIFTNNPMGRCGLEQTAEKGVVPHKPPTRKQAQFTCHDGILQAAPLGGIRTVIAFFALHAYAVTRVRGRSERRRGPLRIRLDASD